MQTIAQYVDHMGTDLSVVNAARVSFSKMATYDENGNIREADKNLIAFLAKGMRASEYDEVMRNLAKEVFPEKIETVVKSLTDMATHWTPFAHTAITLRMKAPVPIRTQAFKHKVGFVENEESRRYISGTPEIYIPEAFRAAPTKDVKQGSGDVHVRNYEWLEAYQILAENAISAYEEMIADGIAPEQARFILPQGVYVNWIWTGSLAAFARYCKQRLDSHAQKESTDVAMAISDVIQPLFPVSWKNLVK